MDLNSAPVPSIGHNNPPAAIDDLPPFREGEGLLRGARRISMFLFGNEDEWRAVYSLAGDLPIFRLAGRLTARPSSLARAISKRERDAIGSRQQTKAASVE
jgi:hypothetical protein